MAKAHHTAPLIPQGWVRVVVFLFVYLALLAAIARLDLPFFLSFTAMATGGSGLVFLFRKMVDRSSFIQLGWKWKGNETHAGSGFLMAIAILGTGTCILLMLNALEWMDYQYDAEAFFGSLALMLLVAFSEELVFRGYIQHHLQQSLKPALALMVSAALFAIFHAANPGTHWLALVNIWIAGILLGINYAYTANLWFGIALHFAWNFLQGPILGYPVSGLSMPSILIQQSTGPAVLTGGSFGFEGSVVNTLLCSLAVAVLFGVYRRQKQTGD